MVLHFAAGTFSFPIAITVSISFPIAITVSISFPHTHSWA